jgi:pyridoxal phosphate enzyme (YggS family)
MTAQQVASNLARIRERIAGACARAGRTPGDVLLVAVSKQVPLDRIVAAWCAGQRDFGENRIQAGLQRQAQLADLRQPVGRSAEQPRWHFIGHLQSNKAGKAVGAFVLLHAVDGWALATRLQARAEPAGCRQPLLVEVNVSREPQKQGVAPERAVALAAKILECPHLQLQGLMTMARFGAPEAELRRTFAGLRRLSESISRETGVPMPHLSMGMSDDYEAAIAEGATIVRIGTAIFGPRP